MPVDTLRHIRTSAIQMAYKSVVYNWSLRGNIPDHMVVRPVDPWPGDADSGRGLCGGAFVLDGDQLALHGQCWEPIGIDPNWTKHMHGFAWLRDLRAMGGDKARAHARDMIESWIKNHRRWQPLPWRADITGERVALWIALYEFFGASASDEFQDLFFESLVRQARHLCRSLPGNLNGIGLLKGIKGLLYSGLAFEGHESWIEQALDLLKKEIGKQILSDGAHVSRSPEQLLEALQILLDVRIALTAAAYPLPEEVQHAIDKMGPALRFFRYADKHFALFNGAQEGDQELVDCVLAQANVRGRGLQSLPKAGYERITLGRSLIMFDCGRSPDWPHDSAAHAGPLGFEMCYGKDRLFVACGSHPTSEKWRDTLKATSAHNTVTVDYRNACEIRPDGHMARKVKAVSPVRQDSKDAILVEGTHDGYVPLNGISHRRRLFLTEQGHDLRGEDTLTCAIGLTKPAEIAVRFHVHPKVQVSLIREGEEALLRLPGGIGWRMHFAAGHLALEDSIYLGQGSRPRKTKQLVIYGQMTDNIAQIKWALRREG